MFWFRACFASLLLASMSGCPTFIVDIPVTPVLVMSPSSLSMHDEAPTASFYLSTLAAANVYWEITSLPSWLTASQTSGTLQGSIVPVQVTVGSFLDPGVYNGTISVISDVAGAAEIDVGLRVEAHPMLSVDSTQLDIGLANSGTLMLSNPGNAPTRWSIEYQYPWLKFVPSSGTIARDASVPVEIRVDRSALSAGTHSQVLGFRKGSSNDLIAVNVSIEVQNAPIMQLTPQVLDFGGASTTKSLSIKNIGNSPLTWSAISASNALYLSPGSGELTAGATQSVAVTLAREELPIGHFATSITLNTNAETSPTVSVKAELFDLSSENWVLPFQVKDAEFSPLLNEIIAISGSANALYSLNPVDYTQRALPLPRVPRCVSVSLDGSQAAVGYEGLVSLVDLENMSIIANKAVTTDALDIVLAPNGFAYVFPVRDQWENIHCLNLSTGAEYLGSGSIYAGTVARLHPSGNYLYAADNGLSPSDIEKHDLRGGNSDLLYDSPYHGDYAFNGDLWFTQGGDRLFARSGNVFHCTTTESTDLTYAGKLIGATSLQYVADSASLAMTFVLTRSGSVGMPMVRAYDNQNLNFLGTLPLDPFRVPREDYVEDVDALGSYLFLNNDDSSLFVIVRAAEGSGLQNDWAIQTLTPTL